MEHRAEALKYLSLQAARMGAERSEATPDTWGEFSSYPFGLTEERLPYVDGSRMRDDQIEDAIEELERFLGVRARGTDARSLVLDYFTSYGSGRQSDIEEVTRLSNRQVRRELAALIDDARVVVVQEPNPRRNGATPRKRYHWANEGPKEIVEWDPAADDLGMAVDGDGFGASDTGIRHHGTAVQGVTCGCKRCQWAAESALVGELRSNARARGDRAGAFQAGLELRQIRREREQAAARFLVGVS